MNRFFMRKRTDSFAQFDEGQRLYTGSSYAAVIEAPEFRKDQTTPASMTISSGNVALVTCALAADPQRRGVRRGQFVIPAYSGGTGFLITLRLGSDVIMAADVGVDNPGPVGGGEPVVQLPRWTVVDLGKVSSGRIEVRDMHQVKLSSDMSDEPLAITAKDDNGSFNAYVVVTTDAGRFPFSDVLVDGRRPVWTHLDSFLLPVAKWMLRLVKVADTLYAELHADIPGGVETDPDGGTVVSAEVND